MDWIDPRYAVPAQSELEDSTNLAGRSKETKGGKMSGKIKGKPLSRQVSAALSQPLEVWTSAYDHALGRLKWPSGCSSEHSFLWSAVIQEQAEVLVRAGMSAKKLAAIVGDGSDGMDSGSASRLAEVVGLMDQSLDTLAFEWLDTADTYAHAALGVVAVAWHLPEHARRAGNDWLTQWVQALCDRMASYTPDLDESVMCHLAMQCELPLLVGVATAASKRTVLTEASKAMDALAEYIETSSDAPAPWLAHGASYLRACLASIVRCRVLANSLGLRKWYPPQQRSLAELLIQAARNARPDGTQWLTAGNSPPRPIAMWDALRKQAKNPKAMRTTMTLAGLTDASRRVAKKKSNRKRLPDATFYCADAAHVCMVSDWHRKSGRLALDFSDNEICIEVLGPKGQAVLAGEWTASAQLDGQAALQLDEWDEVCWFSDEDVDYLELEARFGKHAKIQRQCVLFRQPRLLLLADALLCDHSGPWSLESRLPLAGEVQFEPAQHTTEGHLRLPSGAGCLVMPLHLPEWRRSASGGTLQTEVDSGHETLVARQHSVTQRIYTATLICLDNSASRQPFTWRRLTVGEDLRIVGPDEAVAYRIQIGRRQWVFYRTLAEARRRTALGMHTLADFFAGRFRGADGQVETLVEVEAAE